MKKQNKTCIAAIKKKNGRIMMAGDRRASWDFSQAQAMPRPKISKKNGVLLGGTGDGYLCTLIVDILEVPEYDFTGSVDKYMHFHFYNAVNKLLRSRNMKDEHNLLKIPGDCSAEIIIGMFGFLYGMTIYNPDPTLHSTNGLITIDELNTPYATGCGGQLAWGSLLTTEQSGLKAKERLVMALNVAAQVSPGCDSNIDIIEE